MRAAGEGRAILDSYSYELRDEGGPIHIANNVGSKGRQIRYITKKDLSYKRQHNNTHGCARV
jgi:hypothetical protein